jgi:DNA-binding HxlR family transcriptional regulator
MQHTRFDEMPCPIARGLDRVGEWWSILILRDAFHGKTRFDQFQKSLGIAPNILSRRLSGLVQAGLMERVRYNDRPPRDEYLLTEIGQDFRPVLRAMLAWGNKHFMPAGTELALDEPGTGQPAVSASVTCGGSAPEDHTPLHAPSAAHPDSESRSQS